MKRIFVAMSLLGAGCGGGGDYDTIRDVVIAICEAGCDRIHECDESVDAGNCVNSCVSDICSLGDCSDPFEGSSSDVDACVDAFDDYACTNEALPAACNDVL